MAGLLSTHLNVFEGIYIISLSIGGLLSIIGALLGGSHLHIGHGVHSGHGIHPGHAMHIGHGAQGGHGTKATQSHNSQLQDGLSSGTVPLLDIQSIFSFMTGYGAVGLCSYLINKSVIISEGFALLAGIVFWSLVHSILKLMVKNQTEFLTSTVQDAVGHPATVVSKILQDSIGEVMYSLDGSNKLIRATSKSNQVLKRGEKVVIVKVEDGIATVVKEELLF